jgi:hypothetical protein
VSFAGEPDDAAVQRVLSDGPVTVVLVFADAAVDVG